MTKPLRFTVDIAPDPEHPATWVATCVELGSTSAARSPQDAFAAAASGLRLMVNAILDKRGTSGAGLEVLREIEAGYAQLRREAMQRPADPDAPHRWIPGGPYEACGVCGTDPRNAIHRDLKPANIQINRYDPSLSPEALAALDELAIRAVKSRPRVTQPEFDPSSVARADDGALVVPLSPRGDAGDPEQRLLDRARGLAADPFGEY